VWGVGGAYGHRQWAWAGMGRERVAGRSEGCLSVLPIPLCCSLSSDHQQLYWQHRHIPSPLHTATRACDPAYVCAGSSPSYPPMGDTRARARAGAPHLAAECCGRLLTAALPGAKGTVDVVEAGCRQGVGGGQVSQLGTGSTGGARARRSSCRLPSSRSHVPQPALPPRHPPVRHSTPKSLL